MSLPTNLTLTAPGGTKIEFDKLTVNSAGDVIGFVLDNWTNNPAPVATYVEDIPLVTGSVVVAGRHSARKVTIEGTILAETPYQAQAMRATVVSLCRDRWGAPITMSWTPAGQPTRRLELLPYQQSVEFDDGDDRAGLRIPFRMFFIAPDPVAYASEVQVTITGTYSSPQAVTNTGSADAFPTIVGVVSGSGQANQVRVGNKTLGRYINLSSLGASSGDEITIIMEPGYEAVLLNGVSVYAKRSSASRWWYLRPGSNNVYAEVTSGTATVAWEASWRPGFID